MKCLICVKEKNNWPGSNMAFLSPSSQNVAHACTCIKMCLIELIYNNNNYYN